MNDAIKIKKVAEEIARRIDKNRNKLIDLLTECESHEAAEDEIYKSIDTLTKIDSEIPDLISVENMKFANFLPLNLPLYSLILFGVIPSFMASDVFVRPSMALNSIFKKINEILDLSKVVENLHISPLERNTFINKHVLDADVVIFIGKYKNSFNVLQKNTECLFLYSGAGINPIIVFKNADIEKAVEKVIYARTFNSGQDCAGPDAILIHKDISDSFIAKLKSSLDSMRVGEYGDDKNKVGKLIKKESVELVGELLKKHEKNIIYGGKVDLLNSIVFPTIIKVQVSEYRNFTEYFSPVFFLHTFDNTKELDKYFQDDQYKDYAMYVSIFGDNSYISNIKNTIFLKNTVLPEVERGYKPYGGFGKKANFIYFRGKFQYRPILISREVSTHLGNNKG